MEALLKEFSKAAGLKYASGDEFNYSYAAGYFESVVSQMYSRLSKEDQEMFTRIFQGAIKQLGERR
jgi:hypothetical protein